MKIDTIKLSENTWSRTEGNTRYRWQVASLIQWVKEKEYVEFELPLDAVDLSWLPFGSDNILEFIQHVRRVNETDLQYPILIDSFGTICDGWHRVCKAILEGKSTIKAIRIDEMPVASHTEKID